MSPVYVNGSIVTTPASLVLKTLGAGATKTLDLSTADIYYVELTQATVLTVSNVPLSKAYWVIARQTNTAYFPMSWMTDFVNGWVASGPAQMCGAVDVWSVYWDGSKHFGIGAKDVQG